VVGLALLFVRMFGFFDSWHGLHSSLS
jgi:hypothetical protein